jgi:pilus assembly protein CpaB
MGRRTFLLIASIVVAAIGTGLVAIYVSNADERARTAETLVQVYVAKQNIPQGKAIASGMVQQEKIPQRLVSESAVTDLRTIAGKVTSATIYRHEQIITQMFISPSQAPANIVNLVNGKVAVMVQMADPARLSGLLQPGSQVDVYAPSEEGGAGALQPLIRQVTVLSPGGTVTAPTGVQVTTPANTVTLELERDQAPEVIRAALSGSLYFALLSGGAGSGNQLP